MIRKLLQDSVRRFDSLLVLLQLVLGLQNISYFSSTSRG